MAPSVRCYANKFVVCGAIHACDLLSFLTVVGRFDCSGIAHSVNRHAVQLDLSEILRLVVVQHVAVSKLTEQLPV